MPYVQLALIYGYITLKIGFLTAPFLESKTSIALFPYICDLNFFTQINRPGCVIIIIIIIIIITKLLASYCFVCPELTSLDATQRHHTT